MHEHHNSICTNQVKSNRIHVGIAIPDTFFQSLDSGLGIYNPGIPAGLQTGRFSRIMIVTIYIGCYNKLAFHDVSYLTQ